MKLRFSTCSPTSKAPTRNLRRYRADVIAGITALAAALLVVPASAEHADRDKPLNLQSDRVNVDDINQVSTFEGNVVLTQGTLVIRGDKMVVKQDAEGFQYGTTYGNLANFREKRDGSDEYIEGWAERIEYDNKTHKMQMFNRAFLKKGGADNVRGSYISYDEGSEFYRVVGGGKEAANAGANPDGRVHAVIIPKSVPATPSAPLTLKPSIQIVAPREPTQSSR